MSMLSQRDSSRQTAHQYLHTYQGDSQLFPILFEELIYPLFSKCMSLQKEHVADYRIAIVIEAYQRIMRGMYSYHHHHHHCHCHFYLILYRLSGCEK